MRKDWATIKVEIKDGHEAPDSIFYWKINTNYLRKLIKNFINSEITKHTKLKYSNQWHTTNI